MAEPITASFEIRLFHYLDIIPLERRSVIDSIDCSFACLQGILCVSFNVAAFADDGGKIWCELLPSNIYRDATKLAGDHQYHHYSMWKVINK